MKLFKTNFNLEEKVFLCCDFYHLSIDLKKNRSWPIWKVCICSSGPYIKSAIMECNEENYRSEKISVNKNFFSKHGRVKNKYTHEGIFFFSPLLSLLLARLLACLVGRIEISSRLLYIFTYLSSIFSGLNVLYARYSSSKILQFMNNLIFKWERKRDRIRRIWFFIDCLGL